MSPSRNSKQTHTLLDESFSPVVLPESPVTSTPQRNLTGYPRVARDVAADIFNNIQEWNSLHIKGSVLVKEIALMKAHTVNVHPVGLEPLTVTLHEAVSAMEILLGNFRKSAEQLKSLIALHKSPVPLFLTWPVAKFSEVADKIYAAYKQDFELKCFIAENIAHISGADKLMFYAVSWIYQPYITDEVNVCLESLLTETGHRSKP